MIIIGNSQIITSVHHIEDINTDTYETHMSVYKYLCSYAVKLLLSPYTLNLSVFTL